jgi:hypothetical protein
VVWPKYDSGALEMEIRADGDQMWKEKAKPYHIFNCL